jgi:hypothetical protein
MTNGKQPYNKWFKSTAGSKRVKKLLQNVGFPLEISARSKLKRYGYAVSNSYYSQIDASTGQLISSEIDIYAYKSIYKTIYHSCVIAFDITIIGDWVLSLLCTPLKRKENSNLGYQFLI